METPFQLRMNIAAQKARESARRAVRAQKAAVDASEPAAEVKLEPAAPLPPASKPGNPYKGLKASRKAKPLEITAPRATTPQESLFVSQSEDDEDSHTMITSAKAEDSEFKSKSQANAGRSAKGKEKAAVIKRPFAPPKKLGVKKTFHHKMQMVDTRVTSQAGTWYSAYNATKQPYSRGDLETIRYVNVLIKNCENAAAAGEDLSELFDKLRNRLHVMEFFDFLTGMLLKRAKVLEEHGLENIFNSTEVDFPWDICADAVALYRKWLNGVIDPHLLRGIDTKQGKNPAGKSLTSRSLNKSYIGKKSCNYVGAGSLVNGQWWPLQICAMRDGAHGEIEAGIHGQPGTGAFSIVLSGGGYSNIDQGDIIQYCGTSGKEEQASAGTKLLLKSQKDENDIRVLRSASLDKKNKYRPPKGLRYDGIYRIIDYEILDKDTAMHRFTLRRRNRQDPIRCTGVEKRPTDEELAEYTKIRNLIGLS